MVVDDFRYKGFIVYIYSTRIEENSELFRSSFLKDKYENIETHLKNIFQFRVNELVRNKNNSYSLKNIEEIAKIVFGEDDYEKKHFRDLNNDEELFLPYKYIDIIDFSIRSNYKGRDARDVVPKKRCGEFKDEDVECYDFRVFSRKKRGKKDYHYKDWFLIPTRLYDDSNNGLRDISDEIKIQYDVGLLFADSKVMRAHIRDRLYNVFLPPLKGKFIENIESNENASDYYQVDVVLLPFITLSVKPDLSAFTRMITLSLIILPIKAKNKSYFTPKDFKVIYRGKFGFVDHNYFIDIEKIYQNNFEKIFFGADNLVSLVASFLEAVTSLICPQLSDNEMKALHDRAEHIAITAVLPEGLTSHEIGLYYQSNQELMTPRLQKIVSDPLLYRYTYSDDSTLFVKINELSLNDRTQQIVTNLVFFIPRENRLVFIAPEESEDFPEGTHIKGTLTLLVYQAIGLSIVKSNIKSFNIGITELKTKSLIELETEFIIEMEEFYDIDIVTPSVRLRYPRLRYLSGVEREYLELKDKINSLKIDQNLKDQSTLNLLLLTLTGSTIIVSFFVKFYPQVSIWYFVAATTVFAVAIVLWRFYNKILQKIKL